MNSNLYNTVLGCDKFFSNIIQLIPKELYKQDENEDEELDNAKYYKHKKQALSLDEKKKISKQNKKLKYSVENKDDITIDKSLDENEFDDKNIEYIETGALETLRNRLKVIYAYIQFIFFI